MRIHPKAIAAAGLLCCSKGSTSTSDGGVTTLAIEVDYATNAQPASANDGALYDLVRANVGRLYQGTNVTIDIPSKVSSLEELKDVTGQDFTGEQLQAIAAKHRGQLSTATTLTFYVVYVDGYYNDGAQKRTDVLGVSLGNTGIIGMFAPVIKEVGSGGRLPIQTQRFASETTLIHEISHAIGLVNNGVALTSAHHDSANGKHCTSTECIMYYTNESTNSLRDFVTRVVRGGDSILFDSACLADIDATHAKN